LDSNRVLYIAIVLSLFCLAIVIRLANFETVFTDITGHLNFIDTDNYYYLRRLAYFLVNFPDPLVFDHTADWPVGRLVDWPEGFLWLVGLPLWLIGVDTYRELEIGASIISVLF